MSDLDVIEIPGYPGWYARRRAVEAWQRAGSPELVSAGRLYLDQKYLYDGWRAGKPGFNPADNPDDETQRLAHVRFVAFDLLNPSDDRAAMIAAGFLFPYSYEPWHAELPNVRSYGIVREIPASAGGGSSPFTPPSTPTQGDEDDIVKIYSHGGNYLIIGPKTFLELGDALAKKTGVDGTETLELYRKLGAPEIKLSKREWDVLRINTRASA